MEHFIGTTAGVNHVDQPAGGIAVKYNGGGTLVAIVVDDHSGNPWHEVYLNWQQAAQLLAAVGAAMVEM